VEGTIIKQNDEQQIVTGAVLIPDEPDHDGDTITKEKIEEVAYEFMLNYRNIDIQHTLNNVAYPVESWVLREGIQEETVHDSNQQELPEGTWMLSVHVPDEDTWKSVKNGELTGFSMMGVPEVVKAIKKSKDKVALKRTTLQDMEDAGHDWIVPAVSLVDEPAVPKAEYVSLKDKGGDVIGKLREVLGLDDNQSPFAVRINGKKYNFKEGRQFNRENREKLEAMLIALSDMLSGIEVELIDHETGRTFNPQDIIQQIDEEEEDVEQHTAGWASVLRSIFFGKEYEREDIDLREVAGMLAAVTDRPVSEVQDWLAAIDPEQEVDRRTLMAMMLWAGDYDGISAGEGLSALAEFEDTDTDSSKGGVDMEEEKIVELLKEYEEKIDEKIESLKGLLTEQEDTEEEIEKEEEQEEAEKEDIDEVEEEEAENKETEKEVEKEGVEKEETEKEVEEDETEKDEEVEKEEDDSDDGSEQENEKTHKELENIRGELDAVKAEKEELEDVLQKIQKKFDGTIKSNQLEGQDDGKDTKTSKQRLSNRDEFGRKRK